jgi:P27 family predicted phage terminase small subunit
MPQQLKTVAQIRLSGNSRHLTPTQIKKREKAEAGEDMNVPGGSPGRPRVPLQIKADVAAFGAWKEAVRLLRKRGTLSASDAPILTVYALVFSKCMLANADIASRGFEVEVTRTSKSGELYETTIPNPSVRIATDCERQLLQLAKALGLSPDSREKVRAVRRSAPKPKWNPSMLKPGTLGMHMWEKGLLDPQTGKPLKKEIEA